MSDNESDCGLSYYKLLHKGEGSSLVKEPPVIMKQDMDVDLTTSPSRSILAESIYSDHDNGFGLDMLLSARVAPVLNEIDIPGGAHHAGNEIKVNIKNELFTKTKEKPDSPVSAGVETGIPALPPTRTKQVSVGKDKYPPSKEALDLISEWYGTGIMNSIVQKQRKRDCPVPDHPCFTIPNLDGNLETFVTHLRKSGVPARLDKFYDETIKDDFRRLMPIFGPLTIGAQHAKMGTLTKEKAYDMFVRAGDCAAQLQLHMNLQRRLSVLYGLKIKTKDNVKSCSTTWPDFNSPSDHESLMGPILMHKIVEDTQMLAKNSKSIVQCANHQNSGYMPPASSNGTNYHVPRGRNYGSAPYQKPAGQQRFRSDNFRSDGPTTSWAGQNQRPMRGRFSNNRGRVSSRAFRRGYVDLSDNLLPKFTVSCDSIQEPVGGRTRYFVPNWASLTSDPWILKMIQGIAIDFESAPLQNSWPPEIKFSDSDFKVIDNKVIEMLRKGVIAPVHDHDSVRFVSQLFLATKKDGGFRPIINLKKLNEFVHHEHFKMEGLHCLPELISKDCYMIKLDLKDAYFTLPVDEEYQDYFVFSWRNKLYKFRNLPFGFLLLPDFSLR